VRRGDGCKWASIPDGSLDVGHGDSREWNAKLVDKDVDLFRDHNLLVNVVGSLNVITLDEVI
jgi:hypothetical protein